MPGTPKNLRQAIRNGFSDAGNSNPTDLEINMIAISVKDYLAQKFTIYTLNNCNIEHLFLELFDKIMNDKE